MLHIGEMVKAVFDSHPKNHNIEWFANQLHCNRANVYNIFKRCTMDVELLQRISLILDTDFFSELSKETRKLMMKSDNTNAT